MEKRFEFHLDDLDNSILVECARNGSIIIRATRDNVSDERKAFFIRQIATEGFIPDGYQWFYAGMNHSCGVHWIHDPAWSPVHADLKRHLRAFARWSLLCFCVLLFVAVCVLMVSGNPADVQRRSDAAVQAQVEPHAGAPPSP